MRMSSRGTIRCRIREGRWAVGYGDGNVRGFDDSTVSYIGAGGVQSGYGV
jgi:hypothetical protein